MNKKKFSTWNKENVYDLLVIDIKLLPSKNSRIN